MTRPVVVIAFGLLATLSAKESGASFQEVIDAFLAQAPIKVGFHYTLTQGDFQQAATGVLYVAARGVFRLELWDKIYSSDGTSLYLHDKNTHQTVIDSLRWTTMNLWLRLLHGELPSGTEVTVAPAEDGMVRFRFHHQQPTWSGELRVDTLSGSLRDMRIIEEGELEHHIRLELPESWTDPHSATFMQLQDLPGSRLDLR